VLADGIVVGRIMKAAATQPFAAADQFGGRFSMNALTPS
jgi:hypothetical protein